MPKIFDETDGVYTGTLKENAIVTMAREKRPFIDVHIPEFFSESAEYPLTYVPMLFMTEPLFEGDEVKVYFNQDKMRYPVLWKATKPLPDGMFETFALPSSGSLVSFPSATETLSVQMLQEGVYWLATEHYSVLRYEDKAFLMDSSGFVFGGGDFGFKGDNFNVEASSSAEIVVGTCKIILSGNKFDVDATAFQLGETLKTLVSDITALMTVGPPPQHVLDPGTIAKMTITATKLNTIFQ